MYLAEWTAPGDGGSAVSLVGLRSGALLGERLFTQAERDANAKLAHDAQEAREGPYTRGKLPWFVWLPPASRAGKTYASVNYAKGAEPWFNTGGNAEFTLGAAKFFNDDPEWKAYLSRFKLDPGAEYMTALMQDNREGKTGKEYVKALYVRQGEFWKPLGFYEQYVSSGFVRFRDQTLIPLGALVLALAGGTMALQIGQAALGPTLSAAYPGMAKAVGTVALQTAVNGGDLEAAVKGTALSFVGGQAGSLAKAATGVDAIGVATGAATTALLKGGDPGTAVLMSLASYGAKSADEFFKQDSTVPAPSLAPTMTAPTLTPAGDSQMNLYSLTDTSAPSFGFEPAGGGGFSADYGLAQGDGSFGLDTSDFVNLPADDFDFSSPIDYGFGGDPSFGLDVSGIIDADEFRETGGVDYGFGTVGSGGAGLQVPYFEQQGDYLPQPVFTGPASPAWTGAGGTTTVRTPTGGSSAPAAAGDDGDGWIADLTQLALAAIQVNAAYQASQRPQPRTSTQAANGQTATPNANGTITVRSPTGQTSVQRPPVGVPYVLPDGSTIINNGNGTFDRIGPTGARSTIAYEAIGGSGIPTAGSWAGAGSFLSSIPPVVWLGGGGLLLAALLMSRRR